MYSVERSVRHLHPYGYRSWWSTKTLAKALENTRFCRGGSSEEIRDTIHIFRFVKPSKGQHVFE